MGVAGVCAWNLDCNKSARVLSSIPTSTKWVKRSNPAGTVMDDTEMGIIKKLVGLAWLGGYAPLCLSPMPQKAKRLDWF